MNNAGIDSVVNKELRTFEEVELKYPKLGKYKELVTAQIKKHYILFIELMKNPKAIDSRTFAISGLLLRSLNYYKGALWSLATGNQHVFADCLRSICETMALAHYINKNPEYVKIATSGKKDHENSALRIVNIQTMIRKLDKKHEGIVQDYEKLCNQIHPNPESLFANVRSISNEIFIGTVSPITEKEAEMKLVMLIHWTNWFFEEMESVEN